MILTNQLNYITMVQDELQEFNEHVGTCINDLNTLLQSTTVCKNERIMLRINRFKKWLLKTQTTVNENSGIK